MSVTAGQALRLFHRTKKTSSSYYPFEITSNSELCLISGLLFSQRFRISVTLTLVTEENELADHIAVHKSSDNAFLLMTLIIDNDFAIPDVNFLSSKRTLIRRPELSNRGTQRLSF